MNSSPAPAALVVVYTDGGYKPHNAVSRFGHGGWAWWVDDLLQGSGPYLNAESSEQVERLAAIHALSAFASDSRRVLLVADNLQVVQVLQSALRHGSDHGGESGHPWGDDWEDLAGLARARGERLHVVHTHGHGRGRAKYRRGNAAAHRLATKARKAAATVIASP